MAKRNPIVKRDIHRWQLPNGVRVISERVNSAPGVALGIWVHAGSRYEELKESGMTHLIQRLAFYGTANRSTEEIANEMDSLGGEVSARTDRDHAAYLARIQPNELGAALDLLADIALRPKLNETGMAAEQQKLLEEIRATEKDPDFVLEGMFLRSLWKGHGLCRPPRGRLLTYRGMAKLESFKLKSLQGFHKRSHRPKGLTITAAGKLDHDKFSALVERHFSALEEPKKTVSSQAPSTHQFLALRNRPSFSAVRFQIGVGTGPAAVTSRYTAAILNAMIAAGTGSRLTRLMRDRQLQATRASSSLLEFRDAGCLSVRVRATRPNTNAALDQVVNQLRDFAEEAVDQAELERAQATRKAALYGEIDSMLGRIENLARQERHFGSVIPFEEHLAAIEDVSAAKVRSLASEWFTPHNLSLAVLGNLKGVRVTSASLRW